MIVEGMLFPESWARDFEYTRQLEAAMEAQQDEQEAWLDENAWLLELPEAWPCATT